MDSLSTKAALGITVVIALSALSATSIVLTGQNSHQNVIERGLPYQAVAAKIVPSGQNEAIVRLPVPWSDEWYDTQKALQDGADRADDVQAF